MFTSYDILRIRNQDGISFYPKNISSYKRKGISTMVYKIYSFCIRTLIVVKEIIRIAPVVGVKERRGVEAGESVLKESEGFRRQG